MMKALGPRVTGRLKFDRGMGIITNTNSGTTTTMKANAINSNRYGVSLKASKAIFVSDGGFNISRGGTLRSFYRTSKDCRLVKYVLDTTSYGG